MNQKSDNGIPRGQTMKDLRLLSMEVSIKKLKFSIGLNTIAIIIIAIILIRVTIGFE